MKYIPGYKFVVGASQRRKSASLMGKRTSIKIEGFETGKEYVLYNVRPNKEKNNVTYRFVDTSTNTAFEIEFNSLAEADAKLSKMTGG